MEQELKPVETQEQRMGFFARISGIFFEPRKVFNYLNFKPTWFLALILIVVIGVIVAEITLPQNLLLQKELVSQSTRIASAPEVLEKMADVTTGKRITAAISTPIVAFIWLLILTSVVYFFCNIILGGESSYKKLLSIVTYTFFIPALGSILKTPLILAKNSADVQTSLAILMAGDYNKIRHMLLSALDIFSIWQLILIALGITVLYKFSSTKAFIAAFVGWLILVILGTGLGILGMSVSGIPVTW